MKHDSDNPRPLDKGMGVAVARRTYLRRMKMIGTPSTGKEQANGIRTRWETWGEVAARVAKGNCSLVKGNRIHFEKRKLQDHIANGSVLLSGRHLQHGDDTQSTRSMEVFTNCSTASASFMKFYLLLNGSGVGRCYDDDLMVVDWSKIPHIHCTLDEKHPDYDFRVHESLAQAMHKYGEEVSIYHVEDSREGWAKALEFIEVMAYEGKHTEKIVLLDFSNVRPKGSLIGGMQLRPSSGPVPTMNAFDSLASLKGCLRPNWWQNMYVDHYMAESVLVGGARRSARIAVKHWRDPGIIDFVNIKQKISGGVPLWSANNSVGVDEDFWAEHDIPGTWASKVFNAICHASYEHETGEPGIVNLHKLSVNRKDMDKSRIIGTETYPVIRGEMLLKHIDKIVSTKKYVMIPNPCGEISLYILGAYCVIGDVAPYHCDTLEEFYEAVALTAKALMRTNLMHSMYNHEVKRTNRIGVSLTGIHEFAWKFFQLTFKDLVDESKSQKFWEVIAAAARVVVQTCTEYAEVLGVEIPHTCLTIKPSGSISKLFGLTEGAHLPSMLEYIRWVQFRYDDPLIEKYKKSGYKTQELKSYEGTVIVGFPTRPEICRLGMEKIITAPQATPEEQYKWLMLLEKHWLLNGGCDFGNQVSYTLKYDKSKVTFNQFKKLIGKYQPKIRTCSVMPTTTTQKSSYEYLPEQSCTLEEYDNYCKTITAELDEHVDLVHVDCSSGGCPIDFKDK